MREIVTSDASTANQTPSTLNGRPIAGGSGRLRGLVRPARVVPRDQVVGPIPGAQLARMTRSERLIRVPSPARVARLAGLAGLAGLALAATVLLGGCGIAARGVAVPPVESTPSPLTTVSAAVELTRLQVARALGAAQFQLTVPNVPFRPPESPRLTDVPRAVYQVLLPNDPTHGFIVIYEFPDSNMAALAGNEMAAYLGTGPGRIQFPPDSRHVLRQLDTTLIFYSWSPANSPGPQGGEIASALQTIGVGFAIPR